VETLLNADYVAERATVVPIATTEQQTLRLIRDKYMVSFTIKGFVISHIGLAIII
jgi:hypothetical protein